MAEVSLEKIKEAQKRIRPTVACTSIKHSLSLSNRTGLRVLLKLENLNLAGSFKIRGATNALMQLPDDKREMGIVAASAGNHAQGVAYVCRRLQTKVTVFMPIRTPLVKAEATRELGAEVHLVGKNYDEAYQAAVAYQKKSGGTFIHAFDDAEVINGQGTIGLELLEQVDDLGMVITSVGGGGLISGIGCALKESDPDITLIGAQASAYPSMRRSLTEKRLVATAPGYTIADGIAVNAPSERTFNLVRKYIDDVVLVDEDAIASSVMDLMERDHMLAEGAGATSVAALLHLDRQRLSKMKGKSVVCIVTGGNIDVHLLNKVIPRGLKYSGRLMRLAVRIHDRPGHLADLLNVVGSTGANLIEVNHNRVYGIDGYEDVVVNLDLETTNRNHQKEVAASLRKADFYFALTE